MRGGIRLCDIVVCLLLFDNVDIQVL
jgi:hypothetical protein